MPVLYMGREQGVPYEIPCDITLWHRVDNPPRVGQPYRAFDAENGIVDFLVRSAVVETGKPARAMSVDRIPKADCLPQRSGPTLESAVDRELLELDVDLATGSMRVRAAVIPVGTTHEQLRALLDALAPLEEILPGHVYAGFETISAAGSVATFRFRGGATGGGESVYDSQVG